MCGQVPLGFRNHLQNTLSTTEIDTERGGQADIPPTEGHLRTDFASYEYRIKSFVAARAQDAKDGLHFWIGENLNVHRGNCRKSEILSMNWYVNR